MENIYLVSKYYNNGENYEDECEDTSNIRAFPTKEEAEEFIKGMDNPVVYYPENETYFEVFEGDELFKYCYAFGQQFKRYFLHKVRERYYDGEPIYETSAYFIEEIPFGNAWRK